MTQEPVPTHDEACRRCPAKVTPRDVHNANVAADITLQLAHIVAQLERVSAALDRLAPRPHLADHPSWGPY